MSGKAPVEKSCPPAGNIHDLSAAITHKKEIITLYLQGYLTPTIAAKTKHSKEAVDRYIRDYESVKIVRTATDDIDKISQITKLSKRVISQYLDLIPQHSLNDINANLDDDKYNTCRPVPNLQETCNDRIRLLLLRLGKQRLFLWHRLGTR